MREGVHLNSHMGERVKAAECCLDLRFIIYLSINK